MHLPTDVLGFPSLTQYFNGCRDEYCLLLEGGKVKWKLITKIREGIGPLKSEELIKYFYF